MRKPSAVGFMVWPFAVLLLFLCLSPGAGLAANANIALQLRWTHAFQFAGFYMALEKGYYRDAGLNVTLREGGPGRSSVAFVLKHTGNYAVADSGALLAFAAGKPIRALGAIFQHSPLALMVRKGSGIKKLTDLRGKRIMLQAGYQDAELLALLRQAGITEHDFVRQDSSFNLEDLISGKTDAFSVYTTEQPHQLKMRGIPYRLFYPDGRGIDFYGDILITSAHETRYHPERARAFMQATARGWNDALDHVDDAIDLILLKYNTQHFSRDQLQFEAAQTAKLMMRGMVAVGYMNPYRWQRIANGYAALGLMPAGYPLDKFVYHPPSGLVGMVLEHLWQSMVALLLLMLLFLILSVALLRRQVRRRTATLAESQDNYRRLVELVDIGIVVHQKGNVLFANPYAVARMGLNSEALDGEVFMSHIHPDDRSEVMARIDDILQNNTTFYRAEVRFLNAENASFDAEVSSMQLQYAGAPAVLAVVLDVTERKRVAEEKERMQHQVEHTQRLESLGVLAGGIAHDFNNLLAAIMGYAGLAASKVDPGSAVANHLARITQASESAALLCTQMLAYSGRGSIVVEQVDLAHILSTMTQLLEVSIAKGVDLSYHLEEGLPLIEADVAQLQQVIMNLVMNASEAIGDEHGTMAVRAGVMDMDVAYLDDCVQAAITVGRFVYIEVSDSGCGMTAATQAKMFEPFYTTKVTGRGLGMSAMLGIVRGHHGAIHLETAEGEGSTIRVLFPALTEMAGRGGVDDEAAVVPESRMGVSSGTVLVVDDEEVIREMASMVVEDELGMRAITASNGQQALELYRQHQAEISLVLLDMTMPVMDGGQTFAALCEIDPAVRVVISSGYSEDEVRQGLHGGVVAGFLPKPYTPEMLIRLIENECKGSGVVG
ncbi:MAG: ABC transporter substrate-binding protein [Mariprofundales bacterium]|nr:ABC transporter substrate-binding protein [Mariprofundales bacterium]